MTPPEADVQQVEDIVTADAMAKPGSLLRGEGVAFERTLRMRRQLGDILELAARRRSVEAARPPEEA